MTPEHLSSRLEGELRGKAPEEQWGILVEVRSYLLGEEGEEEEGSMLSPEDQAQYDAWTPSERQLEREWAQLMSNVPPEEADEVNPDFDRAPYEDRKRMVWDVRQYLAPHDATSTSTSAPIVDARSLEVDVGAPTTILQVRLADGSRKQVKANHTHTVLQLKQHIATLAPGIAFTLKGGFPPKPLNDDALTLADAKLLNESIVFSPA